MRVDTGSAGFSHGVWALWVSTYHSSATTPGRWHVNHKRDERIWRREGLKVPQKQPKRSRLRPQYPNHVWSYDFVMHRTHNGKAYRLLTVIDEFTHESLAIRVDRKLNSNDVIDCLSNLFLERGTPN